VQCKISRQCNVLSGIAQYLVLHNISYWLFFYSRTPLCLGVQSERLAARVRALFLSGACDEFLRLLGLSSTHGSCEKGFLQSSSFFLQCAADVFGRTQIGLPDIQKFLSDISASSDRIYIYNYVQISVLPFPAAAAPNRAPETVPERVCSTF
jgi:hypothetical protein